MPLEYLDGLFLNELKGFISIKGRTHLITFELKI